MIGSSMLIMIAAFLTESLQFSIHSAESGGSPANISLTFALLQLQRRRSRLL